jgi:hypothetical protein
MRTIRPGLAAALLCVLGACASYNVRLGDHAAAAVRPPDGGARLVRIYYDRDGDLYPQPLLGVPVPNSELDGRHQLKLQNHFELHRLNRQPSVWDAVIDSLRLPAAAPDSVLWTAIQDSLTARAVAAVRRATEEGERKRTLVVLIHGFNNVPESAESGYEAARRHLDTAGYAPPSRTAYLEVYWDGLRNAVGLPIWSRAQFNFPLVGVSFRRVVNGVPADVPVRVITHSSGGPLISNTLWDASATLQTNHDTNTWPRYEHWYRGAAPATGGHWAIPSHPNLRVGMIVPAMPGETFLNFRAVAGGPARIVIGANPNDMAIRKLGLPTAGKLQPSCQQGGSTCLPARRNQYCKVAKPRLAGDPDTRLGLIDFSRQRSHRLWWTAGYFDVHDLDVYFKRRDMARFLDMVFADEPAEAGDDELWCGADR